MPEIIAGTYELIQKLGAGGGGIVYLANHVRLNKKVVLKEDKRKINTDQELLRREVDVLKDLKHPYIPQVYDFFTEGDNVYTAMDYVEGESLDHPLKRGQRFSQAQVIHWAVQLLEALAYLHSPTHGEPPRGFVHSDIKPANLMLRVNGDICLIDFNVALAIGEGVVGISPGYASPEHYGLDFSRDFSDEKTEMIPSDEKTVLLQEQTARTLPLEKTSPDPSSQRVIIPDARSDIYSVGATLYHLLSGQRPAKSATEVIPLSETQFSASLVQIILKAMVPNPNLRYQTAEDMLEAFLHLHENDPRSKHYQNSRRIAVIALSILFLGGGVMTFMGLRAMQQSEETGRLVAEAAQKEEENAKTALELIGNSQQELAFGNTSTAAQYAVQAVELNTVYAAQAQKALTDALGVYELSDGLKAHITVELPSEALKLALSPNGTRTAALYAYKIVLIETETGQQLAELPAASTAAAGFCFLDENTLLYAGEQGLSVYDIAQKKNVWQGQPATRVARSEDGKRAAGINAADSQAIVYDCATGAELQRISFPGHSQSVPAGNGILADPQNVLLALNADGSLLAVSFDDGGLSLFDVATGKESKIREAGQPTDFQGGFFDSYLVFSYREPDAYHCSVVDTKGAAKPLTASLKVPITAYTDANGIYTVQNNVVFQMDPTTGQSTALARPQTQIAAIAKGSNGSTLTSDQDGNYALFDSQGQLVSTGKREKGCELLGVAGPYVVLASRNTPVVQILKLQTHSDAQLCQYDPSWRHTEIRESADGSTVMLFRYNGLHLLSKDGKEITQVTFPNAGQVNDTQYRRQDGESWLEVIYEDGLRRAYSAVDGSVLWERTGEKPDPSLKENFETTRWRIEAPLHETPTVYDKQTGEVVRELEQDSYLIYVTEVGDYLVTQYLSGQEEYYGLLLNQDCETLAYLPNLCDVIDGRFLFDDRKGNVRESRVYQLEELVQMVQNHREEGN